MSITGEKSFVLVLSIHVNMTGMGNIALATRKEGDDILCTGNVL
jgi:hypothetical protein